MVSPNFEPDRAARSMLPEVSVIGTAVTWPPSEEPDDDALGSGSQVGPYRLLNRVGKGGMGVVFRAEQLYPLKRVVALKLIRRGMESTDLLTRFNRERQSLAKLNHPGIARVFDAGSSDDGRPFFAMEFVPGEPITSFSDGRKLTVRQRIELLIEVCDAVQHAHFRGIIHRDLKPGNLLVIPPASAGGRGSAKVIDFGIAKAFNSDADNSTGDAAPTTVVRTLIGTPEYMSPEQAAGTDVDSRADVYSLGVILYELLTGTIPFDRQDRIAALHHSPSELLHLEAISPSKRLSQLDPPTRNAAAEVRGAATGELQKMLRGDLDWIALKAMDEDRERRYATPSDLAKDLTRFLAEEPVEARPSTRVYRVRKFVRRHKIGVAATSAVFTALLLGTIGTAIGLARARTGWAAATNEAVHARQAQAIADDERRKTEDALAELYPATGLAAAHRGDWTEASLWFANAARLAAANSSDGDERVILNRIRVEAALRNSILPVAAFATGEARVEEVRFHPNGKYVLVRASKGEDKNGASPSKTAIWDLKTQRPVPVPSSVTSVTCAAWNPDGKLIAVSTGSKSDGVRIYHFPQFDQPVLLKGAGRADDVKFDPTGHLLLVRNGREVRIWQSASGDPVTSSLKHPKEITDAVFASDGASMITACADNLTRVFKLDLQRKLSVKVTPAYAHLSGTPSPGFGAISPIALRRTALFATVDSTAIRIRRIATGETVSSLKIDGPVQWLTEDPVSGRIAASVAGRVMTARQASDDIFIWEDALGSRPSGTTAGSFSPDGKLLLTTSQDGPAELSSIDGVRGWDAKMPFQAKHVTAAAWSPDGSRFATVEPGGLLRVWAMNDLSPYRVATIPIYGSRSAVRFSPDHQFLLPTGEVSAEAREFHADLYATRVYGVDGTPAGPLLDPNGIIVAARFSNDGTKVIAAVRGEAGNRLHIWNWRTGLSTSPPILLPSDPRDLAIRPRGAISEAAVLCASGELVFVDAAKGQIVRQFRVPPTGRARGMATGQLLFNGDGNDLAAWGDSNTLQVCDAETGPKFKIVHQDTVRDARFSPDGAQLLSYSADGSARWSDGGTGALITELTISSHSNSFSTSSSTTALPAASVRFSPDGKSAFIVTDAIVHLLSTPGEEPATRLLSHSQPLTAAEFSPDGRWIVTASKDGVIQLWHRVTGQLAAITRTPSVAVPGFINFSADGRRMIISGEGDEAAVLAFDHMVSPSNPTTSEKLCKSAELFSGHALEGGSLAALDDEQWLRRWKEVAGGSTQDDRNWHRQQATSLLASGDYRAAKSHLINVGTTNGSVATAEDSAELEMRAVASAGEGDFPAAVQALEEVLKHRPVDREIILNRADMLLAMGKISDAKGAYERALDVANAQKQTKNSNWIRGNWWVSKAYPPGLDQTFPPETAADLRVETISFQQAPPVWNFTGNKGPWVDFNALLHIPRDRRPLPKTAYAQTVIYARNPQQIALSVGTDDLGRVWLNHEVVYSYSGKPRGAFRGQGRRILSLKPGCNTLLAKVVDLERSSHEMFASLSDNIDDLHLAVAEAIGEHGDAAAVRGDFQAAISDITRAIELAPQDTQRWQQLSVLLVTAGEINAWRELCGRYVARFGESNDRNTAERLVRICGIADGSGVDSAVLLAAAERAVAGGPDPYFEWFELASGMAHYRAGNFEKATNWLENSSGKAKPGGTCHAIAMFYLAMAEHRQNHPAEANRLLQEGGTILARLESQSADHSDEWNDRLAAKISQKEATALIAQISKETQQNAQKNVEGQ